ncbi:MAG TPA: hypothetical protein PLI09_27570 [Candidatus Hydrogenedentes bacterium]|nr:hypothetical protein [Candidatus Hydrogenedentota bacterium]
MAQCLTKSLQGFKVQAPLMFLVPLSHTLRGIYFENSSDARAFYVWVFFLPLFIPRKYISFEFGQRICQATGEQCWNADAKDLHHDLIRAIKRDALPFLSKIDTPSDIARAAMALLNPINPYYQQTLAFAHARAGQLVEARIAFDQLVKQIDQAVPWQREMAERALHFSRTLLADPAKAQFQLNEWEVESIRNLGLEKFRSSAV